MMKKSEVLKNLRNGIVIDYTSCKKIYAFNDNFEIQICENVPTSKSKKKVQIKNKR